MSSTASITPTATPEATAWDTTFEEWQPGPGDTLLRAYSDAVNRRLLERWLPASTGRILKTDLFDEAVGTGLVGFLLERAERVSGIDVAPSVVAAAGRTEPRLEAAVADVRGLPYADATFDVVVSTSTLDHFESEADIALALGELRRVLRPGGSLVVSIDNARNPLVALRNALPHGFLRRVGLVPYPTGTTCGPKELSRLVEQAGLVVDDLEAIMHVPRLAVRAAGRSVAGDAARANRLVSRLIAAEPPRHLPLASVSGQFVAVRATRPALPGDGDAGDLPRTVPPPGLSREGHGRLPCASSAEPSTAGSSGWSFRFTLCPPRSIRSYRSSSGSCANPTSRRSRHFGRESTRRTGPASPAATAASGRATTGGSSRSAGSRPTSRASTTSVSPAPSGPAPDIASTSVRTRRCAAYASPRRCCHA